MEEDNFKEKKLQEFKFHAEGGIHSSVHSVNIY